MLRAINENGRFVPRVIETTYACRRPLLRKRAGSLLAALALTQALMGFSNHAAAPALGAPWAASFDTECCFGETIESGATEKQYFLVTNAGTETWGANGGPSINLGTDMPEGGSSEFQAPSWGSFSRPVVGVSHPVPPGASYKFAFDVKAPAVSTPTQFSPHFGLLAEGVVWMDASSALGPDLWLPYNVVPAQPPSISIAVHPESVTVGNPFTVTATSTSVAAVNHITIVFAGQQVNNGPERSPEIVADETPSWSTSSTFNTSGIGSGSQTVVATAYDDAGLSSTSTATIQIQAPPALLAPAPTVVKPFRMYFAGATVLAHPGELRLTRVVVIGVSKGERVWASCHRCKGHARLGSAVATGPEVALKASHLIVTGRSTLVVYASGQGVDGRYKLYALHIRGGSAVVRREGCLVPNQTAHTTCPG